MDAFDRHPIEGAGAGTYEFIWNRDERWSHHVRDAHSLYFETLAELGLPGALLLVIALSALLLAGAAARGRQADPVSAGAARRLRRGVSDVLRHGRGRLDVGVDGRRLRGLRRGRRRRGRGLQTRWILPDVLPRVALTLLALIVLGLQTPILIAAAEVNASQAAVRERRIEAAVLAASVAVHAEPWSADGYLQRALVLEQQGYLDAAAKDARAAVAKERLNAETWLILARIEVERGRTKEAIAAATRARELNPRNPTFNRPR